MWPPSVGCHGNWRGGRVSPAERLRPALRPRSPHEPLAAELREGGVSGGGASSPTVPRRAARTRGRRGQSLVGSVNALLANALSKTE